MRNPTFSLKGKSGGSIAAIHPSDGWIAVELLDTGFWFDLYNHELGYPHLMLLYKILVDRLSLQLLCFFTTSCLQALFRRLCSWQLSRLVIIFFSISCVWITILRLWLFFSVIGIVRWSRTSQQGSHSFCRVSLRPMKMLEITIYKILM